MGANIILAIAGVVIASMALRDVFETVVVPGGSRASLQVARRLGALLLPVWRTVRGKRRGLTGGFAPIVLVGTFFIWIALLAVAFGMMAYAARSHFEPQVESLAEGIFIAGSSMMTVGPGKVETALGIGRWIVLGGGFCGLAVMTMAVTYLLQVQSSVARRDTGIIKLNTSAGDPPSGLTLLERFGALRNGREVRDTLIEGRNWCATVRQSHCAHPTLIYFQSIGVGAGWPAALGAILDLALLAEHCIEDESLYGPAVLLRQEGTRMAAELMALANVDPKEVSVEEAELKQAANRLSTSGYPLRESRDYSAMSVQRSEYLGYVNAMADHLGKPTAMLIRQS
jgi:hypothetical protein